MENIGSTQLKTVCKQNNIEYLGLFGSYAKGSQKDTSDVDLLVRFGKPIGYFKLVEIQDVFENLFKRKVDLVTEKSLSKYIRPNVYKDLKTLYGSRLR